MPVRGCAHRHTQRNAAGWSYNGLAAWFRDRHRWVFIGRWLMRSAMSRSCAGDICPNLFPRVMSRTRATAFSHVPRCCGEWGSVKKIVAPVAWVMRACRVNSPPLSAVMEGTTRRRGRGHWRAARGIGQSGGWRDPPRRGRRGPGGCLFPNDRAGRTRQLAAGAGKNGRGSECGCALAPAVRRGTSKACRVAAGCRACAPNPP